LSTTRSKTTAKYRAKFGAGTGATAGQLRLKGVARHRRSTTLALEKSGHLGVDQLNFITART